METVSDGRHRSHVEKYRSYRIQAFLAVFIGYSLYYVVRSNFSFSTPFLQKELGLSVSQIGFLTSLMLIAYGLSKGVMSALADKFNPKLFMAFGLVSCAVVNIFFGFSSAFWMFAGLVLLNGVFQGMGVGPSYITIANWFPRRERGLFGGLWNISHNIGGGLVAPIAGVGLAVLGLQYWQAAVYVVPAGLVVLGAVIVLLLGKGSPKAEGLPPLGEMVPEDGLAVPLQPTKQAPEDMSALQIFTTYVMRNKNVWYVSLVDVFVYMVRFGMLSWLPIYLTTVKNFSKEEMGVAFLFFEWAAIPSTLAAGWLSDRFLRGRRMPLAIICMAMIFVCLVGYWKSDSVVMVTVFASIVGCLIYVPQFMASVHAIDVVPPFAVGSAVGLRGFMSYVVGASLGTSLFGIAVDHLGWNAGFYLLMGAVICCIVFCYLAHRGALELERSRRPDAEGEALAVTSGQTA